MDFTCLQLVPLRTMEGLQDIKLLSLTHAGQKWITFPVGGCPRATVGGPRNGLDQDGTGAPRSKETAPPIGPFSRTMPRALWRILGGVQFFRSEVPLYVVRDSFICCVSREREGWEGCMLAGNAQAPM